MRAAHVSAVVLAAAAAAALARPAAAADQPLSLVHQGRLLDGNDAPVESADLAMKFEIFAEKFADAGQTALWSGGCPVAVVHGLYAVTLGADCGTNLTTQALPYGQARWLQVSVGTVVLQPRLRLGAVPAAALAGDAITIGGLHPAELWKKSDAVDAATLGGAAPAAFWKKADAVEAATLGGVAPAAFWKKADAVEAATLGGAAPGEFWKKADAVEAATLGGRSLTDLDGRYVKSQGSGAVTIAGAFQATTLAGDGHGLTNLDAGALASGTVPDGRLSGTYSNANQFTNSANQFTGAFKGDGTQLALDAGRLGSGTVPDARLPANLARLDGANTFTQAQSFGTVTAGALTAASLASAAGVKVANDAAPCTTANAGTLRWTGSTLDLCTGTGGWIPLAIARPGSQTNPGASCKAILAAGGSVGDGTYWVDPDGTGPNPAVAVFCDMTSYGGGWTRCLSAHYWTGSKPVSWVKGTWLSTSWNIGGTAFDNVAGGLSFGNICPTVAAGATQIFGEATYATSTTRVKTEALTLPAGFFSAGSNARTTGTGTNAIAFDSTAQGRYSTGCSASYTGGINQGIQSLCINDAAHQQTMHTGWPNGNYTSCPDSGNQPCYCTQDNYCGGTDLNEQKITMLLYVR